MTNLRSEKRQDKNGKLVTRHIKDGSSSPATTRALAGSKPSLGTKKTKKKHYSEFNPDAAPAKGYVPPTYTKEVGGGGARKSVGANYSSDSPKNVTDIAKALRDDLKEAVEAGWLPDGIKYRVKTEKASMTQSIRITAAGLPDDLAYDGTKLNAWGDEVKKPSKLKEAIGTRLDEMVESYNSSSADGYDNYYSLYYSGVSIPDEADMAWEAEQAAIRKRQREARVEELLNG